MKTTTQKTSVSKIVSRFDKELRNLLMNDLKAIKAVKNQLMNLNTERLTAA